MATRTYPMPIEGLFVSGEHWRLAERLNELRHELQENPAKRAELEAEIERLEAEMEALVRRFAHSGR